MKRTLAALPPRPVKAVLIGMYVVALLMAVVPFLYLSLSGSATVVAGIPLSVLYWIFDGLLVAVALSALYVYEDARGELDEELTR